MEILKRISLYIIGIVVFVVFATGFIDESKELYTLIQPQKGEQMDKTVQSKTVYRDLFGKMNYYALFEDEVEEKIIHKNLPRAYAEISRDEFENLEGGDTVEGTLTGAAFSNKDIRSETYEHLILMGVFLIYPLFFIIYQLIHIPAVERWTDRHDNFLGPLISASFIGVIALGFYLHIFTWGKILSVPFRPIAANSWRPLLRLLTGIMIMAMGDMNAVITTLH